MDLSLHLPTGLSLPLGLAAVVARLRGGTAGEGDPDADLLERVQAGDEEAFMMLVERHQPVMLRLAGTMLPSRALAEEVVQDTWLAALRGVDRFAGRSTLRTWLLRILVNRARSTGAREHRSVAIGDAGPAVDSARFDSAGAWAVPPVDWVAQLEDRLVAESLSPLIRTTLESLPERQREVLLLRDVDGLSGEEVCEVLEISEGNQRVLLHRGRSRLRGVLEAELGSA